MTNPTEFQHTANEPAVDQQKHTSAAGQVVVIYVDDAPADFAVVLDLGDGQRLVGLSSAVFDTAAELPLLLAAQAWFDGLEQLVFGRSYSAAELKAMVAA